MTTRQIVVDANVFVSFLVDRNEKQRSMAKANRYDAVATFDQKMLRRMRILGVQSYW